MKLSVIFLFMVEDGASCFHEGKSVDNDGEEVLAHCEKHSKELAGLCMLLFFTIQVVMFVICRAIAI